MRPFRSVLRWTAGAAIVAWAAAAASELGVLPADNPQAPQYARSGY